MDCFWLATKAWMFIVDNRKTLYEMFRWGKTMIKDLLLLNHRVVLEKFNRIDYGISNWSTLSFFLQACQEGAKTFREEQCLRKQSGSVPFFVSSCMCVTLTVFIYYYYLYIIIIYILCAIQGHMFTKLQVKFAYHKLLPAIFTKNYD